MGLITDRVGMHKQAYWIEKKCVTVRSETEQVETLVDNANTLVVENLEQISLIRQTENITYGSSLYGDGMATNSILNLIFKCRLFEKQNNFSRHNCSTNFLFIY